MLPKTGNKLHPPSDDLAFAQLMAEALALELGQTHQAVKTAMRWTGASESCVKHWLAGRHAPSGGNLLGLLRQSDIVFEYVLLAAGRHDALIATKMSGLRQGLIEILALLDRLEGNPPGIS
jgi:hypothetical protein